MATPSEAHLAGRRREPRKPHRRRVRSFRARVLTWFTLSGRRFPWRLRRATRYERVVAEVLLQRTRAESVARFFRRFIREYPSWAALAAARPRQLGEFLRPIGLWERRSRALRGLAKDLLRQRGRFPRDRETLEGMPAVGQYVANSVYLFCHGRAEPLLDATMARVLERYFGPRKLVDIRYDPYLQEVARSVVAGNEAINVNWALLDLGAMVCRQRDPLCDICPVARGCRWRTFLRRRLSLRARSRSGLVVRSVEGRA